MCAGHSPSVKGVVNFCKLAALHNKTLNKPSATQLVRPLAFTSPFLRQLVVQHLLATSAFLEPLLGELRVYRGVFTGIPVQAAAVLRQSRSRCVRGEKGRNARQATRCARAGRVLGSAAGGSREGCEQARRVG